MLLPICRNSRDQSSVYIFTFEFELCKTRVYILYFEFQYITCNCQRRIQNPVKQLRQSFLLN